MRAGRLFDSPPLLSMGVLLFTLSLLELLLGRVAAFLFIVPVEPLGVADELLGVVAEPLGMVAEPLGIVVEPLGVAPIEPVPLWLGSVGFGVVSGVGEVVWLGVAGVGDASVGDDGVVVCA